MSSLLLYLLAVLSSLTQLTTANFDLYKVWTWVPEGGRYGTKKDDLWIITNDHSHSCLDVDRYSTWVSSNDLSHGRLGVRCWGDCVITDDPWPGVYLVEMHFTNKPLHHFTIYKNKGRQVGDAWRWTLFGVDEKSYGECFAYGNEWFKCDWPKNTMHMEGFRKFRCLTAFDAFPINQAHKKEIDALSSAASNMTAVSWEA